MKATTVKISEIKPNPDNPRVIKDDAFKKLVQSIKEFPEMIEAREIVVNTDMVILGGNMRFRALKEAGVTDVPVKIVDWSEDKQREFVIKDNVSGGEWDYDMLANQYELEELSAWGLDLPGVTELGADIEEDVAPEISQDPPVSKLGEIYQLGRHRVMCGDSTDKASVELLMNGVKADMFIGDPPYGMRLDADYSGMSAGKNSMGKAKKHDNVIGDHDDFDAGKIAETVSDIKEQVWFGADYYSKSLLDTEHSGSWAVWDKRVEESQDAGFGSTFELMWFSNKHKRMIFRYQWAGFFTNGEKREYDHPTEKSVRLISRLLNDYCKGNNVLDLFLGSGSTLIACEQTDRTCYGMELDPKYTDVIRKRWAKFVYPDRWEKEWEELTPVV